MKFAQSLRARLRAKRSDDSGFTMVELVIAIPISILILGTVFATIGTAIILQSQVTSRVSASRAGTTFVDQISEARSCPELNYILKNKAADATGQFSYNFGNYAYSDCVAGKSVLVPVKLIDRTDGLAYYNQTLTLAAM